MSSVTKVVAGLPLASWITPAAIFMISTMIVNAGNYGYNLVLGRLLTPAAFAEAGLMITMLLVASFVAMTFQIVATKFTVDLAESEQAGFRAWLGRISIVLGSVSGGLLMIFRQEVQEFFQLTSSTSLVVFGAMLPVFFLMSVKRGFVQGQSNFVALSVSYQSEMWVRMFATLALISLTNGSIDLIVSLAILASVVVGFGVIREPAANPGGFRFTQQKRIIKFLILTAVYEGSQILINYSDILLVNHYFDAHRAGLYTSMALIGRMIYFMTWMVVMILIPKVLKLRKQGGNYEGALMKYFLMIGSFSAVLILFAFLFSEELVLMLFGNSYLPVAPLLWQYGLATLLFALANVLVYYFLSLDHKLPIFIAMVAGFLQLVLFLIFHESLTQMIQVQIYNMAVLLAFMVAYFLIVRK